MSIKNHNIFIEDYLVNLLFATYGSATLMLLLFIIFAII